MLSRPRPQPLPGNVPLRASFLNAGTAWVDVGPNPALDDAVQNVNVVGRIASMVVHPLQPDTLLVGSAQGGAWRTTDGGQHWSPRCDFAANLAIGSLVADPRNPDVVYAGTGEGVGSTDALYGRGILTSADFGQTWSLVAGSDQWFSRVTVSSLLLYYDAQGRKHLLAGTYQVAVNASPTFEHGVYESVDDGAFQKIFPAAGASLSVSSLALDTTRLDLYVGVDRALVPGPADLANGIYVRLGGKADFTPVTQGLPDASTSGRIRLAVARDNSRVYAYIGNSSTQRYQGLYLSVNQGETWRKVMGTAQVDGKPVPLEDLNGDISFFCLPLAVDPVDATRVYVSGDTSIVRVDGIAANGSTTAVTPMPTRDATHPHPDVHVLTFRAGTGGAEASLLAGTDGGLWQLGSPSRATATSAWTGLQGVAGSAMATLQLVGVSVDPTDPTRFASGTQDNGSHLSLGNRVSRIVQTGDGGYPQWDAYGGAVYVQTQRSGIEGDFLRKLTLGAGGSIVNENYTTGIATSDASEFYAPLVLHPMAINRRLAMGTRSVYERRETDTQWNRASQDLGGSVTALAYAYDNPGFLVAGTTGGRVFVRSIEGGPFVARSRGLPQGRVQALAVDPRDSRKLYAAFNQFGGSTVFRSQDAGMTWYSITNNLPDLPVNCLALDSQGSIIPVVYVGTDQGVYATLNDPADEKVSWRSFGTGLPNSQVACMDLQARVLTAGTHGRGVWQAPLVPGLAWTQPPTIQLTPRVPDQPPIEEGLEERVSPLPTLSAWRPRPVPWVR